MPELIVAIIVGGVLGVFTAARTRAIRDAYELFCETLAGFFGVRGAYDDFETFLKEYRKEIRAKKQGRERAIVDAWVRFLDSVSVARNDRGSSKFEGSEKALDKLAEDLHVTFPYMSRWQYISPMVLSAVGVFGSCLILLLAALKVADWQTSLAYVCLMICSGIAGMLLLKVYDQYTLERAERRIRIVINHLKRHFILRTEKDYLLETGRAIQDELRSFQEMTSLLDLRVKRLADEQPSAEAIAKHVNVEVMELADKIEAFDQKLKHHLQDNKLVQNQQVNQLRDTLVEFLDRDRSKNQASFDSSHRVEQQLRQWREEFNNKLESHTTALEKLQIKLDTIDNERQMPIADDAFAKISQAIEAQIQQMKHDLSALGRDTESPLPKLSVVEASQQSQEDPVRRLAVPAGIYDIVKNVKDTLSSSHRSCLLVVEQKRYLTKTLKQLREMSATQYQRFASIDPKVAEDFRKATQPVPVWQEHIDQFKPVTGRIARQVSDELNGLLMRMESEPVQTSFKELWLNLDTVKDLSVAADSLNGELAQVVRCLLNLQKRMLEVKELMLTLETCDLYQAKVVINDIGKLLRSTLRHRRSVKFSVNKYTKKFVPKVRAIRSLVRESFGHFVPVEPQRGPQEFKSQYTIAS